MSLSKLAAMGRRGDKNLGHLTPGEVVVPKEVAALRPDIVQAVQQQIVQMGGKNPGKIVVGQGMRNPRTGIEEFASEAEVAAAYAALGGNADAGGVAFWQGYQGNNFLDAFKAAAQSDGRAFNQSAYQSALQPAPSPMQAPMQAQPVQAPMQAQPQERQLTAFDEGYSYTPQYYEPVQQPASVQQPVSVQQVAPTPTPANAQAAVPSPAQQSYTPTFAIPNVTYDNQGPSLQDINALYNQVLGRYADQGGLEYYDRSNLSLSDIADRLIADRDKDYQSRGLVAPTSSLIDLDKQGLINLGQNIRANFTPTNLAAPLSQIRQEYLDFNQNLATGLTPDERIEYINFGNIPSYGRDIARQGDLGEKYLRDLLDIMDRNLGRLDPTQYAASQGAVNVEYYNNGELPLLRFRDAQGNVINTPQGQQAFSDSLGPVIDYSILDQLAPYGGVNLESYKAALQQYYADPRFAAALARDKFDSGAPGGNPAGAANKGALERTINQQIADAVAYRPLVSNLGRQGITPVSSLNRFDPNAPIAVKNRVAGAQVASPTSGGLSQIAASQQPAFDMGGLSNLLSTYQQQQNLLNQANNLSNVANDDPFTAIAAQEQRQQLLDQANALKVDKGAVQAKLREAIAAGADLSQFYGGTYDDSMRLIADLGIQGGKDETRVLPAAPTAYEGGYKFDPVFGSGYYKQYLTNLGSQLGISQDVINRTAGDAALKNFYSGAGRTTYADNPEYLAQLTSNVLKNGGIDPNSAQGQAIVNNAKQTGQQLNAALFSEGNESGTVKNIARKIGESPEALALIAAATGGAAALPAAAGGFGLGAAASGAIAGGVTGTIPGIGNGSFKEAVTGGLKGAGVGAATASIGQGLANIYNGVPITDGILSASPTFTGTVVDDQGFVVPREYNPNYNYSTPAVPGFSNPAFDDYGFPIPESYDPNYNYGTGVGGIDDSNFDLGKSLDSQTRLQGGGFGDFKYDTPVGGIDDSNFDLGKTLDRQTQLQGGGFGSPNYDSVGGIDDSNFDLGKTIGAGGAGAAGTGLLDTIKGALPDAAKTVFDKVVDKGTDLLTATAIGTLLGGLIGKENKDEGYKSSISGTQAAPYQYGQHPTPGKRKGYTLNPTNVSGLSSKPLQGLKDGGPVHMNTGDFVFSKKALDKVGGLSELKRRGYPAQAIKGPGTGTSDSIPATIDGVEPARVANGEALIRGGANMTGLAALHKRMRK